VNTFKKVDSARNDLGPLAKHAICAFLVLAPMLLPFLQAAYAQEAAAPIASVEGLIRAQQYDKAVELAERQLRVQPSDFRMWTLQGIALSLEGRTADAIRAFDKAMQLSPDYAPALKGETQLLYASSDKRAIPLLERILKVDREDVTAHEMLATLYSREGNCPKAVEEFASISEVVDKHSSSLALYGNCLVELQRYDDAASVFQELVRLLPSQDYPKYDLAVVLVSARQYKEALVALEPLLASNTQDADVLSLASEANEALGNTPQAVSLLRQAIVLNPSVPEYYASFAELCLEHDSFQTGVDMMTVGLKHVPNSPKIYLSRGLLHAQLAEYDAAETDFRTAEKLGTAQSLAAYAIDLSEMERNNPDKALLQVQSQLKFQPENPLLNYLLAKLLMNRSPTTESATLKRARNAVELAIKLKPDLVDAHNLLADMDMTEGHYEAAIEQSRIALRYAPDDETATYHLVIAYRHTGHKEELPELVKHLSQLHQDSLKKETDRKRFRLELANGP
jgi:tetratricopeptide (TPR) repeat protein